MDSVFYYLRAENGRYTVGIRKELSIFISSSLSYLLLASVLGYDKHFDTCRAESRSLFRS